MITHWHTVRSFHIQRLTFTINQTAADHDCTQSGNGDLWNLPPEGEKTRPDETCWDVTCCSPFEKTPAASVKFSPCTSASEHHIFLVLDHTYTDVLYLNINGRPPCEYYKDLQTNRSYLAVWRLPGGLSLSAGVSAT